MNIEKIVPPLELCKKIPAGEFEDSAFVWLEVEIPQENKKEWRVVNATKTILACHNPKHPAPTLQEIMEEIAGIDKVYSVCSFTGETMCTNPNYDPSIHYSPKKLLSWSSNRWRDAIWVEHAETACEAALRTYLGIKNITVTMRCPDCGFWLNEVDNDTKNNIEDDFFALSEICPNCKLEFFDTLCWFRDSSSNLTVISTPMGHRWIKKEKARK